MLSSPKGAAGIFHKTYVDAVAGSNGWNPIELKWDVHPERDDEWWENEKRLYSKRFLEQEYLCSFLGSGDTYVSGEDIEWLKSISCPPIRRDGPVGQVWVWADPVPSHSYLISADVARGNPGGDYSTFHVFDNTAGEVAAEFMGHISPDEFGKLLDVWGRRYNDALLAPELNTYGHHTITVLRHRDYPNFYWEQKVKNPHFIPGPDDLPGYNNQGKNRRERILARMEEVVRNRLVRSYSSRFIHQLQGFVDNGKKAQARKGYHDDLIISFAIGAYIMDATGIDENARKMAIAMLEATSRSSVTYAGSTAPDGPASSQYARAWSVYNSSAVEVEQRQRAAAEKRPKTDAERDYGARLSPEARKRLGGLGWLY